MPPRRYCPDRHQVALAPMSFVLISCSAMPGSSTSRALSPVPAAARAPRAARTRRSRELKGGINPEWSEINGAPRGPRASVSMDRAPLCPRAAFPYPRSNDARLFDALRPVSRPAPVAVSGSVPVSVPVTGPAPALVVSVAVQTVDGGAGDEGEQEALRRRAETLEARCEELRARAQSAAPTKPRPAEALPETPETQALREALAASIEENRRLALRVTDLEQALAARDRAVDELAGVLAGHAEEAGGTGGTGDVGVLRAALEAERERAAVFEAELARVKGRIARGELGG